MAKMVKKKPDTPPHEEHADETWLIPYSDLLTLLLALFIVPVCIFQPGQGQSGPNSICLGRRL